MELRIRSGSRFPGLFFLLAFSFGPAYSQSASLICDPSGAPTPVRLEGLTERLGDILFNCSGGTPGAAVNGSLTIFLPVNITNRIAADGSAADVSLTIDTGAGFVPSGVAGKVSGQNITFSGLSLVTPAGGKVSLRISGLRSAVNDLGVNAPQPIQAFIGTNGLAGLSVTRSQVSVGYASRGLQATLASGGIQCTGSPLPSTINFSSFFLAGTNFASTRITEGISNAFEPKNGSADTGTRILVRYSKFPAGARIFIPDVIAGSSAVQATAAGDLGGAQSGGQYAPGGNGSLLLARVIAASTDGTGGLPAYTPGPLGSGTVAFSSVSEVYVVNGSGYAVYEVMDANPAIQESAQFPTFIVVPSSSPNTIANEDVSFAPVSMADSASTVAPVPRFAAVAPVSDCASLRDCSASYFPSLDVNPGPLSFSVAAGSSILPQPGYIPIRNSGGGLLSWTASVTYKTGSAWLNLQPASGFNNGSVRAFLQTQQLAPGNYEATITIDAGPLAGSKSFPVTLVVTSATTPPAPVPIPPSVVISSVTNAADLLPGPVAPGSLAVLKGSKLAGKSVAVSFDGIAATVLSAGDSQIQLQVPSDLGSKTSAQVVVTVDGVNSAPQAVALAPVAPAIFANGILNQNSSVNGVNSPAAAGSVVQIFATGLPATGAMFAKIHDRDTLVPLYAGAAPDLPGIEQINVAVPDDLPAMTTEVLVCSYDPANQRVCSRPAKITLGQ